MDKQLGSTAHLTDRGDKTIEELEKELPQAAIDLVDATAAKIAAKIKKDKRRFYRRNREAWDRMNRPARLEKIELGMQRTMNLVAGHGFVTDEQLAEGRGV